MNTIKPFLLAFILLLSVFVNAQHHDAFFKKGDRVCFVGNSITHNGEFHHNILQYYATRLPKQQVSFFNAGIKGDVTAGILRRIDTDIMIHKPTHCVVMIGMNDVQRDLYGKTITQNADTLSKRKAAIELYSKNLDSIVRFFLSKRIKVILQKPSAYDQTSTMSYPNNFGVNDALVACGMVIEKIARQYNLKTIDYTTVMTNITNQIQKETPNATLTVNDRVHPNSIGHFIMSYQFLKSTNAPSIIAKMVIDVKNVNDKKKNKNCTVKSIAYKNGGLHMKIIENALPYPITDNQQKALNLVPFMQDFNQETIQIHNLDKGNYQLLIDSVVIDNFSNDALLKGINLAAYNKTPQYQQALLVRKALEQLWENEAIYRSIAFVEHMCLNGFDKKNDMTVVKKYLDSLYIARFKGQSYYSNAFGKYVDYKLQTTKLLIQADSLRNIMYKLSQTVEHTFTIKKVEESTVQSLIEASQSGAMPLLFDVQPKYATKETDTIQLDKSHFLRDGLPNFFNKIKQKKPTLLIAFLGGSITKAEDQYRNQTLEYLQTLNPNAKLKGINAGVSGTGTELGACRLNEQVLKYNPDLVFIEFAVNGGSNEALEGIVRQIIKNNPQTDICFIYTIAGEQYKQYASQEIPSKIQGFEKVANHYKIPSIHMGLYPSFLVLQEKLIWKSNVDVTGKMVFSKDGTHPTKVGGDLYAQTIIKAFRTFKKETRIRNHDLINPLYIDNWEDAGMYTPMDVATFTKGWENINLTGTNNLKAFAPWFSTIAKAVEPNASLSFKFKGTAFGFFDIGGPEVGQILVEIDGNCVELKRKAGNSSIKIPNESGFKCLINRFNTNCNNRYRGQFEMIEVTNGEHEIKITLSSIQSNKLAILEGQDLLDIQQNSEKYKKQEFYLGRILIKGVVIK